MASNRTALWVAAAVTLLVTLLRLLAELQGASEVLASRQGGGPGALLGIAWLMFLFGGWFGYRLHRQGAAPMRAGAVAARILGFTVGSIALGLLTLTALGEDAFPWIVPINAVFYCTAAWLAYRQWPALGRWLLAYGVLARLPVIAVTAVAVPARWGTHYEKIGPGEGVPMDTVPAVLALSFAQLFVWIPWTVLFGGATGALVAWLCGRGARGARR